jgi:hypothetical protein
MTHLFKNLWNISYFNLTIVNFHFPSWGIHLHFKKRMSIQTKVICHYFGGKFYEKTRKKIVSFPNKIFENIY